MVIMEFRKRNCSAKWNDNIFDFCLLSKYFCFAFFHFHFCISNSFISWSMWQNIIGVLTCDLVYRRFIDLASSLWFIVGFFKESLMKVGGAKVLIVILGRPKFYLCFAYSRERNNWFRFWPFDPITFNLWPT